jgi:enoyl-[acyl-carrier protein] reductase II
MKLKVCQICGIKYPIFLGPMIYISKAPLVAAFSQAGGLGCLASAGMNEEEFHEQVNHIRLLTDSPFGINIAWTVPDSEKILRCCLDKRITVVISSAGSPEQAIKRLKKANVKIFQVVSNVAQAIRSEALGVDGVIVKGFESGGLNALGAIASLPLIPQVVDAISIPVIAAGGIGDGRGMTAAMALGADGILMGTRFLASYESPIHINYKNAILRASDIDTVSLRLPNFAVRVWRNERVRGLEHKSLTEDELWKMVSDLTQGDDVDQAFMGLGQVAGLIKMISSVEQIIEEIIQGFKNGVKILQNQAEAL